MVERNRCSAIVPRKSSARNGRGLTARDLSGAKSLGLLGMRERAMMLDGEVTIAGRRGKGTRVVLCIPLAKPPETTNT